MSRVRQLKSYTLEYKRQQVTLLAMSIGEALRKAALHFDAPQGTVILIIRVKG